MTPLLLTSRLCRPAPAAGAVPDPPPLGSPLPAPPLGPGAGAAVAGLAAAGLLAGVVARVLLARMRRGARVRAPVCEVGVCLAWGLVAALWARGAVAPAWLPVLLGLGWLAVAASVVDVRHRRLPDALTLPAGPVLLALLAPLGAAALVRGLGGAAVALAGHALVHVTMPRAMGAGDVKLAASVGAVLAAGGWSALAVGTALAAALTAATGLAATVLARARGRPPPHAVAHGPSMLGSAWLVVLVAAAGSG